MYSLIYISVVEYCYQKPTISPNLDTQFSVCPEWMNFWKIAQKIEQWTGVSVSYKWYKNKMAVQTDGIILCCHEICRNKFQNDYSFFHIILLSLKALDIASLSIAFIIKNGETVIYSVSLRYQVWRHDGSVAIFNYYKTLGWECDGIMSIVIDWKVRVYLTFCCNRKHDDNINFQS